MTTSTQTATTFSIVAESDTNNRTKRARWAKNTQFLLGVSQVTLGKINRSGTLFAWEGAEVVFAPTIKEMAAGADAPWYIETAWLDRDLEVIAAVVVKTDDASEFLWNAELGANELPTWLLMNEGRDRRAYEVASHLNRVFAGGDQHTYFKVERDRKAKEHAEHVAHQNHIAAMYEAAANDWRLTGGARSVLNRLPEVTDEQRTASRTDTRSAFSALKNALELELVMIVRDNLGKLRCETSICRSFDGDAYGFTTRGEIAFYILNTWVSCGFGDFENAARDAVAREFIRQYLA